MISFITIVHEKLLQATGSILTFLFGSGVGGSVLVMSTQNIDTALRWGVFLVTIGLGILKAYYMIKSDGKPKL